VGTRLLAEVERWARGRGAEQVVLTVWQGNRAAERFYRAAGYGAVSRVMARELS
jgi:GNAT superfamily N-acetyltransferase